jgi:cobalt-zinc-cadmium efflux system membrane fusion protein
MRPTHRPSVPGILLVLSPLLLAACGAEEAPPEAEATADASDAAVRLDADQRESAGIRTDTAHPTELRTVASFPATLAPPDTGLADVGSLVEGRVERVRVVEGDRVEAGQVLAHIHAHELTEALRDLAAAEAREDYATRSLDRSRRLLEAGAVSREEVERREAEAAAARAERARSADMVELLDPSPTGEVTVRAPRDGVVLSVAARPSQSVTPGSPLFTVGPEGALWATAYVPESEAVGLGEGGGAEVRFRSLPGVSVPGRVVSTGRRIDPETRTVAVRVELERVPPDVRAGMFATVALAGAEVLRGVELPAAAVQRLGDRDVVFVVEAEGRYRPVPVQSRMSGPDRVLVQGLEEGAEVVVEGAYVLKATAEQGPGTGAEG